MNATEKPPVPASSPKIACLGLWVLVLCVVVGFSSLMLQPTDMFVDDAWFYLVIAQNIADGEGSTFSRIVPTNGYHPLWMSLVSVAAKLFGRAQLFRGVIAVHFGLGLAMVAAWRSLSGSIRLPYPVLGLGFVLPWFIGSRWWGSEAWVNGLFVLLTACALVRADRSPSDTRRWFVAGLLGGFMVLARLDLVFLAGLAVFWPCFASVDEGRSPWKYRISRSVAVAIGTTLVVGPYVVFNGLETGHMMPVSGAIKSTFPQPSFPGIWHKLGGVGKAVLMLSPAVVVLALRSPISANYRRLLLWLAGGTLVQASWVLLFNAWGWSTDYGYYHVPGVLMIGLALPLFFQRYTQLLPSLNDARRQQLAVSLVCMMALAGAGRAVRAAVLNVEDPVVAMAREMRRQLPEDAVIWSFDAPGRLAWFSERRVLAADGLTHGFDYDATLRELGPEGFLRLHGVTQLVLPLDDYATPWGKVSVVDGGLEVSLVGVLSKQPAGDFTVVGPPRMHTAQFAGSKGVPLDAGLFEWTR